MQSFTSRSRWAALGAAIAVTLGGGGIGITHALTDSGPRAIYQPINPCRLSDLRPAPDQVGPRPAPLGANETYTLSGWGAVGNCALPSGTTGLALNVTALGATMQTFLTVFPASETQPKTSNLNPSPGQSPTPNAVNVKLNDSGQFSIYNLRGNVNVVIDVVGVYNDHNHDDRYFTEAEVTTALAAKVDDSQLLSAVVGSNGTLVRGVGVASSTKTFMGEYNVVFNRDVSACTFAATPGTSAGTGVLTNRIATVAGLAGQSNGVYVYTATASTSVSTDTGFHLIVVC